MPTLFSRIIAGELPGRFVYTDDRAVAFLTIAPVRPGHTLVVPRTEVGSWTDAEPDLLSHCTLIAQRIGRAVERAWDAPRSALVIAGFEVDHLHLHVWPVWSLADFDFSRADTDATDTQLDDAAERVRATLGS